MRKFKKLLSILLITTIIFPILPVGEIVALAAGELVSDVIIYKDHDRDQNLTEMGITIIGQNLKDKNVKVIADSKTYEIGTISNTGPQTFKIKAGTIEGSISMVFIGDKSIKINDGNMPSISGNGISPRNLLNGDNLTITGSNLDQVGQQFGNDGQGRISAKISSSSATKDVTNEFSGASDSEVVLPGVTGSGLQRVIFEKTEKNNEVNTSITYNYYNQFRIYKNIEVEGLQMTPNSGKKGTTVRFEAPINEFDLSKNLKDQDVFFLKRTDGKDPYSNNNKGMNRTRLTKETRNGKDYNVFTVQVPSGIDVDEYFVVLTNPIKTNEDPLDSVVELKILDEKFTVIQGGKDPSISKVDPNKGSDTGVEVEITGRYIGTMNINEYKQNSDSETKINLKQGNTILEIDYGKGYFGKDKEDGTRDIVTAKREIRTIIGDEATFLKTGEGIPAVKFTESKDTLNVKTAALAEDDLSPKKDVVIIINTIFTKEDGTEILYVERAELKNGFEYIPSMVQPEIDSILPSIIQVEKESERSYKVPEGRQITIHGENLMIHKYLGEDGLEIVRYPKVQIGAIEIDKNTNPEIDLKVLDKNGNILDGTEGKEFGSKIIFTMPKNRKINQIGMASLSVTNPTRNSENDGYSDRKDNFVEFMIIEDGKENPYIEEVRPNSSPIEGGQKVTIVGSNFEPGLTVLIDGEEIKSPKLALDGKSIEIVTPKGREAKTQIQVINPKGESDWKAFTYIIAYSQPKIISFNHRQGEEGTGVVIKGTGFALVDPMSSEEIPEKLIGARVILGDPNTKNDDVNKYNRDSNGEIEFKEFKPGVDLFTSRDGKIKVADFYSGIILQDQNGKKYIVEKHANGKAVITDNGQNKYNIQVGGSGIQASKSGGSISDLTDTGNGLEFNGLKLKYKTAYENDGRNITGQNARVIDENTIYFYVPEKANKGHYDLTVINPDTKKDTREGNNGYEYLKPLGLRPTITNIIRSKGDVAGGYPITIEGSNFPVNEENRPEVHIDGQLAKVTDVNKTGTSMEVIVPKYIGDLRKKKITELPVMVSVQKSDGLSVASEDLFSYIISNTEPKITKIRPNEGSTSGDMVEIDGMGFLMQETGDDINGNGFIDDNLIDPNLSKEERDILAEKSTDIDPPYSHYFKSEILPEVYFGSEQSGYEKGKILDFSGSDYLRVLAPKSTGGKVDIYIMNNDGGRSNKISYTFIASEVSIGSINPDKSSKEGNIPTYIKGRGFNESEIDIIKELEFGFEDSEIDKDMTSVKKEKNTMALVRFGDLTNKNLARTHENSGLTRGPITNVEIDGGLTVEYRIEEEKLSLQIKEGEKYYKLNIAYDGEEIYVPVNLLKSGKERYKGFELIKVSLEDRRLLIERGFAPSAEKIDDGNIKLRTPSYFEAKKNISVYIFNEDGGSHKLPGFEFTNPDSEPYIDNIKRDACNPIKKGDALILKVNYGAESNIIVTGDDFRANAKIRISDFLTIENPVLVKGKNGEKDQLSFRMPKILEEDVGKVVPLIVMNEDGGNAWSHDRVKIVGDEEIEEDQIFIEITKGDSNPKVTSMEPVVGSASGGTRVLIKGSDFRKDEKTSEENQGNDKCRENRFNVYFGDAPVTEFISVENDYTEVVVPPSAKSGEVEVRVVNPDGETADTKPIFTYISKPKIKDMNPKTIFTNDEESVVTIQGEQFQSGAQVIVGGKLVSPKDIPEGAEVHGSGISGVDENGKNIELSLVGGKKTASSLVEDENTLKVTFNTAVDLENSSVIIINPDGGISEPYDGFEYEKPVPLKPMVLEGIPGFESTVQLLWNKSDPKILNSATKYEIYGRKTSDKENTFLGDTTNAGFLVRGLDPNVEYEFLVRALNEHGAAIDFASVKVKTLSVGEDKKQKEKDEKVKEEENIIRTQGKEEMQDGRMIITLGTASMKNGLGTIDLSLGKYKNKDKFTISIPLALARTDNVLTINEGTMTSILNVRDLYTLPVSRLDKGDKDAYVRIHIDRTIESHIPRGKRPGSKAYELYFDYVYGKESIEIHDILRSGQVFLSQDTIVYPNKKNATMYKFDIETGNYSRLGSTKTELKKKTKLILLSDR